MAVEPTPVQLAEMRIVALEQGLADAMRQIDTLTYQRDEARAEADHLRTRVEGEK